MERIVIDFQYYPIRRHLQLMPVEIPVVEVLVYLLYRVTECAVRAYRQPHLPHPLQSIGVAYR